MYCVRCGVELADSEEKCPLCATRVYHPDLERELTEPPFPAERLPQVKGGRAGLLFVATMLLLLPVIVCLLCDWHINGEVIWSGYVAGGILVAYVASLLPLWFRRPNPVIFVPCAFATVLALLLYVNWKTDGDWFLSLAFPVTGGIALIITAVVALMRYVPRGWLYIFGGAFLLLGGFSMLIEFLVNFTFGIENALFWSFFPLSAFAILGAVLLTVAICRPLRESLRKKLFF